jgi:hypothetical protein
MRNGLHFALVLLLTGTPLPMPGTGFRTCRPEIQSAPSSCCGSECRCGRRAPCVCRTPEGPISRSPAPDPASPVAGSLRIAGAVLATHPAALLAPPTTPIAVSPEPAACRLSMSRLERFCTLLV